MSLVERRCGEALTARLYATYRTQALLRGVVHNVQRPRPAHRFGSSLATEQGVFSYFCLSDPAEFGGWPTV